MFSAHLPELHETSAN